MLWTHTDLLDCATDDDLNRSDRKSTRTHAHMNKTTREIFGYFDYICD